MNALRFDPVAYRRAAEQAEAEAMPALQRLMKVGERSDSGGERVVRRFLLGLYNGGQWPFDLTDLRVLDPANTADVFTVLKLDANYCQREIHKYLEDGDARFQAMWDLERPGPRS